MPPISRPLASNWTSSVHATVPEFKVVDKRACADCRTSLQLPPPTYSPPTPPFSNSPIRRVNLRPPSSIHRATTSAGGTGTESPQSNLSRCALLSGVCAQLMRILNITCAFSPEDSSCGMATSPVDTTGSLSDSFMMPNEMEAVRMYYAEAGMGSSFSCAAS